MKRSSSSRWRRLSSTCGPPSSRAGDHGPHRGETSPTRCSAYLRVFWKQRPSQEALPRGRPGDGALALRRGPAAPGCRRHHAHAHHRLRRAVDRGEDLHPERARRTDRRAPIRPLHPVRGRGHHAGPPALRELEHWCESGASAALAAALHGRAACGRPHYYPFYAKWRRARHPAQHPHLGQLDVRRRERPRPPAPTRSRRAGLPGAPDHHEPRRLPVGAGGVSPRLEVRERLLELAAHRPKYLGDRGRAGSRCYRFGADDDRRRKCFWGSARSCSSGR